MKRWIAGIVWLLAIEGGWAQDAIRFKDGRVLPARPGARYTGHLAGGVHYLLQFEEYPGRAVREELERRHIRVLAYVPDSALMVTGSSGTGLEGLGITWAGPLEARDKVSPQLSTRSTTALLVVFHRDVAAEDARLLVEQRGFDILPNRYLLSGQLVVTGSYGSVAALAASDAVAFILPASADLVAGNPVMACAGALTEAGLVAEYVKVGRGWSREETGGVALQYYLQTLTAALEESVVRGEVDRAFREWQKYANVTFSDGGKAGAARTIAIQFARSAHGDAYPFDGRGGVLAHTFYPAPPNSEPVAGDLHLDADEGWHAGSDTDLFSVVLHELGHALGLGHSDRPGAVMYPYYRFASGLTDDDIAGITDLYGLRGSQPGGQPAPAPVPPPAPVPAAPPKPAVTDTMPPALRIQSPGSSISSTAGASVRVSGAASDDTAVKVVQWSTSNGDRGNANGTASWAVDVPLLVGSTVITIRAYDFAGNSGWRSVTVVRR